jgi:hypothetical protein
MKDVGLDQKDVSRFGRDGLGSVNYSV